MLSTALPQLPAPMCKGKKLVTLFCCRCTGPALIVFSSKFPFNLCVMIALLPISCEIFVVKVPLQQTYKTLFAVTEPSQLKLFYRLMLGIGLRLNGCPDFEKL